MKYFELLDEFECIIVERKKHMTNKDLQQIDKSIRHHGDGFWNDSNDDGLNNRCLIHDIIECLNLDGFDLQIIQK